MRSVQLTMTGQRVLDLSVPVFVKWAGGKGQLLEQLSESIPESFNCYFEPFLGGGSFALFILKNYAPREVYLSDINEELINAYKVVRDNVDELIDEIALMREAHSEEFYYKVRALKPKDLTPLKNAARFIYLNKTCFNGLYRVNSKGGFNVPIGSYTNPSIIVETNIREASELLKKAEIKTANFEEAIDKADSNDFIYLDPPYYPLNKGKSFTTYTKDNFLEKEQIMLADKFKELNKKGCKLMLSNSDTKFIKELYNNFNQRIVKAKRMINCDATKRGAINELVVTNY